MPERSSKPPALDRRVGLAVFPELCLTGYSIDDLLLGDVLLDATLVAIETVRATSAELLPVIVVGAPLRNGNRLYNCAVVLHRGQVLGVVPKSYLPNYREFYEKRHFAEGAGQSGEITLPGVQGAEQVPFGPELLFEATDLPGFVLGVEICEDMWVPLPPSTLAALAGATVIANPSGSPITVGRADDRELMCRSASARGLSAYIYAATGPGESSTDLSWDGQTSIHENGVLLATTDRFPTQAQWCTADVDLDLLRQERLRQSSFDDCARQADWAAAGYQRIGFELNAPSTDIGLRRHIDRFPFVPDDASRLAQDCYEAYSIQVYGLKQRLAAIGNPKVVLGVSGGLDSTHALLVAARAMDEAGRPRSDILTFTMPGFATTDHTRNNATELATALGCTFETLDIRPAAEQMLGDLGHPLDEKQIEALGAPDILLVPIGGTYTITTPEAVELIRAVKPHTAIAMHFKTVLCGFAVTDEREFVRLARAKYLPNALEITRETLNELPAAGVMLCPPAR